LSTKKHSWVFFEIGIENGFLATKNEKKLNFRNFFRKSSKTQRMFIVFVDNGLTKWRGRLKFCMRLRNRYKYHVLASHTSSQKSTVFFLTFSLDYQKFFRKSSKTHRKRQNIQCLTEDPSVYFLIVYKKALLGFLRNPLRKWFFGYRI